MAKKRDNETSETDDQVDGLPVSEEAEEKPIDSPKPPEKPAGDKISMGRFLADGVPGPAALKRHFQTHLTRKNLGLGMRPKNEWLKLYESYLKE